MLPSWFFYLMPFFLGHGAVETLYHANWRPYEMPMILTCTLPFLDPGLAESGTTWLSIHSTCLIEYHFKDTVFEGKIVSVLNTTTKEHQTLHMGTLLDTAKVTTQGC